MSSDFRTAVTILLERVASECAEVRANDGEIPSTLAALNEIYAEGWRDLADLLAQADTDERLSDADVVIALNAIASADDPERAHSLADDILLSCVPDEIRAAYERVQQRAPWWASS